MNWREEIEELLPLLGVTALVCACVRFFYMRIVGLDEGVWDKALTAAMLAVAWVALRPLKR